MVFSEFVTEVVTSAAVSAALTGLLLWLTKSWIAERLKNTIKNEYDQKLESHKASLKAASDVEVEKLKADLTILANERHIRFSKLHEIRAEVIVETYFLLKELYLAMADYVKLLESVGDKTREERLEVVVESLHKFKEFYKSKAIYLPKNLVDKLDYINNQLTYLSNIYTSNIDTMHGQNNGDQWLEVFETTKVQSKQSLIELEGEFRRLLGDAE